MASSVVSPPTGMPESVTPPWILPWYIVASTSMRSRKTSTTAPMPAVTNSRLRRRLRLLDGVWFLEEARSREEVLFEGALFLGFTGMREG